MRAITVLEPWASGLVYGTKRIENRTWWTSHRGPLVIHAGQSRRLTDGADPCGDLIQRLLPGLRSFADLRYGRLLGVVDLVDCVLVDDLPGVSWVEGPWCWVLKNLRAFPSPIPFRGRRRLFDVPDDLIPAAFR